MDSVATRKKQATGIMGDVGYLQGTESEFSCHAMDIVDIGGYRNTADKFCQNTILLKSIFSNISNMVTGITPSHKNPFSRF